jgi:nucleoside-diphosphate-sugar epimerase
VVSLRLPAIYGPGDTIRRAIGNFIRAAAAGTRIDIQGDGEDLRELIYAGDAAEAAALAFERKVDGVFNVASGRGISIREMAETVQRVADTGVEIGWSERQKPRAVYVLSVERARTVLDWRPRTSLEDGVRAQLSWVRASG